MSGITVRLLAEKRELERKVAELTRLLQQERVETTALRLEISNLRRAENAEIVALEQEIAIAGPDKDRIEFMYSGPVRMNAIHQAIQARQNNPPDLVTVARGVIDAAMT